MVLECTAVNDSYVLECFENTLLVGFLVPVS